jgi:hypothetical protein
VRQDKACPASAGGVSSASGIKFNNSALTLSHSVSRRHQVIIRPAMMIRRTNTNGISAASGQVMTGHLGARMPVAPAGRTPKRRGLACGDRYREHHGFALGT